MHGTLLILNSFLFTSITSVMLLEDFTVPSAFVLSVFFLKIKYNRIHYFGIFLVACGITCSVSNDAFVKKNKDTGKSTSSMLLGDLMAIGGAFCYALSNILQEHFLKTTRDVHHYLGFLGLFGFLISMMEAFFFGEFTKLNQFYQTADYSEKRYLWINLLCFMFLTALAYSIIPIFVKRSGATLLNIT